MRNASSLNPIPGGGGGIYFYLRAFKYVALIIKNSCDFSQVYFEDTLPPLPKYFSRLYSTG